MTIPGNGGIAKSISSRTNNHPHALSVRVSGRNNLKKTEGKPEMIAGCHDLIFNNDEYHSKVKSQSGAKEVYTPDDYPKAESTTPFMG